MRKKLRMAVGVGEGLSYVNSGSAVPGNRIYDKDVNSQLTCIDCLLGARDCSKNFTSSQQPCEMGTTPYEPTLRMSKWRPSCALWTDGMFAGSQFLHLSYREVSKIE